MNHVERTIDNGTSIRPDVKAIRTAFVSVLFSKMWQLFVGLCDIVDTHMIQYIVGTNDMYLYLLRSRSDIFNKTTIM